MAFTESTVTTDTIQNLADLPNLNDGLSSAQLKAKFDYFSENFNEFFNDTFLVEIASTADGSSGADSVGATAVAGLSASTTIQPILEELKAYIDTVASNFLLGTVPDNSITTAKYQDDSVDKDKINADLAGLGLAQNVDGSLEVTVDDSTLEIDTDIVRAKDGGITDAKLATDVKVGSLAALNTTEKGSVVGSINEVDAEATLNTESVAAIRKYPTATGTVDAIVIDQDGFTLIDGNVARFKASGENTTVMTANVEGTGAIAIKDIDGNALDAGAVLEDYYYELVYDTGTSFFILAPKGGTSITGATEATVIFRETIAKGDTVYTKDFYDLSTLTKLDNPGTLPTGNARCSAFSADNNFLAVGHDTTPFITIYSIDGDTFTKLSNPGVLPTGLVKGASFSPDSSYLVVGHAVTPFVTIYSISGSTFTKIANPGDLPPDDGNDVAFNPLGTLVTLALADSPGILTYSISDGDTFTKTTDPSSLPAGNGLGVDYNSDGSFVAISNTSTPYVTIYTVSGETFTKVADPGDLPAGIGKGISFSDDDSFLAVAHNSSPRITIYSISGTTFTKIADPGTLPAGNGIGCWFSSDSVYLAVSHDSSPYITVYSISGSTFTKLANPGTLPNDDGTGVTINWNNRFTSSTNEASPYVTIYKGVGGESAFKADNDIAFAKEFSTLSVGYALENGVDTESKKINKILEVQ